MHGTLWLIVNAHRRGLLGRAGCESLIDELANTDMALPVRGDSFFYWATEQGLLP